ncbi:hypothetical protein TRVL_04015 [Trypanosoma vivax]|nr:hypothetical protein TRVL_04015 [Trypanosoma vivax]
MTRGQSSGQERRKEGGRDRKIAIDTFARGTANSDYEEQCGKAVLPEEGVVERKRKSAQRSFTHESSDGRENGGRKEGVTSKQDQQTGDELENRKHDTGGHTAGQNGNDVEVK